MIHGEVITHVSWGGNFPILVIEANYGLQSVTPPPLNVNFLLLRKFISRCSQQKNFYKSRSWTPFRDTSLLKAECCPDKKIIFQSQSTREFVYNNEGATCRQAKGVRIYRHRTKHKSQVRTKELHVDKQRVYEYTDTERNTNLKFEIRCPRSQCPFQRSHLIALFIRASYQTV